MKRKFMSYFNCSGLDFCSSTKTCKFLQWNLKHTSSLSSSTGKASLSQSKCIYWPAIFYTDETNTYSRGTQESLKWHSARHWSSCFQIQKTNWPESQISSCLVESSISKTTRNSRFVCLCPVRMCWMKCLLSGKEWFGLWRRNRFCSLRCNI